MKAWKDTIESRRKESPVEQNIATVSDFAWMRNDQAMENPYHNLEDSDVDDENDVIPYVRKGKAPVSERYDSSLTRNGDGGDADRSGRGVDFLRPHMNAKVNYEGNYLTLEISSTIKYQSLIDRIDTKIGTFSNNSIGRGTLKLRYCDEDGDIVVIENDDDIRHAYDDALQRVDLRNTEAIAQLDLYCEDIKPDKQDLKGNSTVAEVLDPSKSESVGGQLGESHSVEDVQHSKPERT